MQLMRKPTARIGLLSLLIVAQALTISVVFDASTLFEQLGDSHYGWLGYMGLASKALFAWVAALLVALGPRLGYWFEQLRLTLDRYRFLLLLTLQLLAFASFFLFTQLISTKSASWEEAAGASTLPVAWLALMATVAVLWLAAVAPLSFWIRFARQEVLTIAFACVIAAVVWMLTLATQNLWDPLSAYTFNAVASILQWFYADMVIEPEQRIVGVGSFLVEIAAVCSGYEGIGLVLIFTGFYLFIFRREFRFPHCLLLLPVGVAAIWCFNILRIAMLLVIGAELSPELAVGGFHSMAGWISFVVVTACILLLAHSSSHFSRSTEELPTQPITFRMALLIPLIVLLAATMVTSALTISVDWWYPLRVVLTAGALVMLWQHYRSIAFKVNWVAVAAGVMVFLFWILLVPDDPVVSAEIEQQFQEIPSELLMAWLVFRTLGAVITVPLAEELAFRGYLFEWLKTDRHSTASWARFPWIALIASSILFGLLHSAWLAGILAGIAYGLVRCYRNNVADAFVAHATTNGLLSVYVLSTGHWAMW